MMGSDVPLVAVSGCGDDAEARRVRAALRLFANEFGADAAFAVRVPGRVNLIGEHVDYSGYAVLPMALDQDVIVAARVTSAPEISLRNADVAYAAHREPLPLGAPTPRSGPPPWNEYVLCGVRGALDHLRAIGRRDEEGVGLQLLVCGTVPPAAGLSSSSALVSAACAARLHASAALPTRATLADLCARVERYVGTQGGGMDQAIAFLGARGAAQHISWAPLRAVAVPLPPIAVIVVADSLVAANKAASGEFNRRVVECRVAAAALCRLGGVDERSRTLAEAARALGRDPLQMADLVTQLLPQEVYSRAEVCSMLDCSDEELRALLTADTATLDEFKLRSRAEHVYSEAARVTRFVEACGRSGGGVLSELGALLDESHASLTRRYECSHPDVDRLVAECRAAGADGARLTGAGWGGCVVALVSTKRAGALLKCLRRGYYAALDEGTARRALFATQPGDAARIYIV